MLSYLTTIVKCRFDQPGGNLEEVRPLRRLPMKHAMGDDLHKKWMKNPKYRREYKGLEREFSRAAALIEARARAGLTQEQVARSV
jgi:hypothetical protein